MAMPSRQVDHADPAAARSATAYEGPLVFDFDHEHAVPPRNLVDLLGGKGANLAEMTTVLGINVPPGFTVALPVCRIFRDHGWPARLDPALDEHLARLGATIGRRFGDPADPLLVAVRSGAPVSMPGMLDTVLNLGLNDDTVVGLERVSGDPWFAWDSYRRFLTMFATIVMDVPAADLEEPSAEVPPAEESPAEPLVRDPGAMRARVLELQGRIAALAGRAVPQDPSVQIREAVEAVFRSWESERARAYRAHEGIDADLGTAVNVQAMVFGNRGSRSGTGVVFTRDPSTGEPTPYGDYLPRAQGEDVVAGTAHPLPIAQLGELEPAAYTELLGVLRRLEVHYRDLCDVEFTVEDGRLYLLQTRIGKRSATAAVRVAVDLEADPEIRLTRAEAVARVPADLRVRAREERLGRGADVVEADGLLGTGLGASPGRVSGRIVLSSHAACDATDKVILVRAETSPEDVPGMAASVGILTTRGGLVSHAAVVARGWGIPAVVGVQDITLTDEGLRCADGRRVAAGQVITIDGATGGVWVGTPEFGDAATALADFPQLTKLEWWAEEVTAQG
jgi:pyruvate,orthophosphate dikinase